MAITKEQLNYVMEHINDFPRAKVAREAGISIRTLYRVIHAHGGRTTGPCKPNTALREYVRLHYRDMTGREIADMFGVSAVRVNLLAKKMGVSHSPETVARIRENLRKAVRKKPDFKEIVRKTRIRRRLDEMRVWEGKPQLTRMRLKSITGRAYKAKWHLCRYCGYYECEGHPYVLLYDDGTKRKNEQYYTDNYGLRFRPAEE